MDFFADAVVSYEHLLDHNDDEAVNAMGVAICPGIIVNLTDNCSCWAERYCSSTAVPWATLTLSLQALLWVITFL